jgi:hypothetical protein
MKALKEILAEAAPKFFRFQVFVKTNEEKKNTVGMAYLKEGQSMYTLRLWTFLEDKFYLLPSREDSAKYLVMTREPNKTPNSKNKYFWNIVGNAKANSANGVLEINFDLFEKKVFMNLFPETSATPYGLPVPAEEIQAA